MKNIFENKFIRFTTHAIFWAWNGIFIILILSLVIPFVSYGIFKSFFNGEIPFDFTLILLLGIIVPFLTVYIVVKKFMFQPQKIFTIFYAIEVPLVAVLFLRLMIFRELTAGTAQLLILFILGTSIFLYELFTENKLKNKAEEILIFIANVILLLIGIYAATIILLYSFPLLGLAIENFIEFEWIHALKDIFSSYYSIIFILFFIFSATVFFILPVTMPILFITKFIKSYKINIEKYSKPIIFSLTIVIIAINVILFETLNIQPQVRIFKKYENFSQDNFTKEQKLDIIKHKKVITRALTNSYLAPYRYLSPEKASNSIAEIYSKVFFISKSDAEKFQNFHNILLKPFLYKGNTTNFDDYEAEIIYERIFDTQIQRAEKEEVIHALQARWDRDEVEAGLLNINDEKVHLDTQKINYSEKNGIAEIEIFESYTNKTPDQQEIFYYFSLPEDAVITGLWISDDKTEKKYAYSVSPRGAAQQVYKNEVEMRVDPSLLEQTGPGMYRLRAFPIMSKNNFVNNPIIPVFNIWLKYVCIEKNGSYSLPKLTQTRNVYFDKKTKIFVNDLEIKKDKNWFPEKLEAKTKFDFNNIKISENNSLKIEEIDFKNQTKKIKTAIIIDPSFSMSNSNNDLSVSISELKKEFEGDIYFPEDSSFSKINIEKFNIKDFVFFGFQNTYKILESFNNQKLTNNYDAVIFITDAGNYESSENNFNVINFEKPLYFLHLNNNFPLSYDDAVLETIQNSDGNISGENSKLINQIKFYFSNENKNFVYDTENQLIWLFSDNFNSKIITENNNLKKIISATQIQLIHKNTDSLNIQLLDSIHKIAVENGIVSQFSSMIVLVNDRQKEALKQAENQSDRFDREIEDGKEILTKPNNPFVTGTPEPEEWVLIFISLIFIIFTIIKVKK